ncbi:MAG TPA: lamin tail domain-containing protein [Flavobacteriaceae bacterium]
MKKLYILLFAILFSAATFGQSSDLYFSMYGEGSSNNKFLEIYNGTGSDVDLSNYSVELYANGSPTATETQALSGTLSNGDVYVIYNSNAAAGITANGDLSSTVTFFNGDDALALLNMGTVIDVIGQIGVDPGSAWNVGSTASGTAEHTLVRKSEVCDPNNDWATSAGTDDATSEWTVYASDAEWGQIGFHVACTTSPVLIITSPSEGTNFAAGTTSVDIVIDVQNFNVANGTGDGHIHWTLNGGGTNMKFDTSNISIPVSDGANYTVYMELVDNSHAPIVPAVNATVNFSVLNPCSSNVGDIIINEIMQNPSAVLDSDGEWFEVYNTTGSPIDINGWTISDSGSNSHTISSSLIVPANGYAVLGNNSDSGTNGGVTVNYQYTSFTLANGADSVILTCSGNIIDQVAYDGGTIWPDPNGASMALSTTAMNSTDNDNGANWGTATTDIGSGDFGTPGAVNDFTLSVDNFAESIFKIYPNPTSLGYINISSKSQTAMKVGVYDILGKQVINKSVDNNRLDVSTLTSGIYIMKISQDNATTTKKLVIK